MYQALFLRAGYQANHTYAAIKGEESYELISQGLGCVIAEVNRVIEKGSVLVGEQDVKLEFLSWI